MNLTQLLEQVKTTSSYELYRLARALQLECERPERVRAVMDRLRPGLKIRFYDHSLNREVDAEVIELRLTQVDVRQLEDGRRWLIPTWLINLDGVAMDVPVRPNQRLSKAELSIGQKVGYLDRQNREQIAIIQRLNPKTATVKTLTGEIWRVSYSFLFPIVATGEAPVIVQIAPST